jgi:hypothetical protein
VRRLAGSFTSLAVGAVAALVATRLALLWQPDDLGASTHVVVVRYAGIALSAVLLVGVGPRWLFLAPPVLVYAVPAMLGHQIDLSGDVWETTYAHMVIELVLTLAPAVTLAITRRSGPQARAPLPSPVALVISGGVAAVAMGAMWVAERPYEETVEWWLGQGVAVWLVVALLARHPRRLAVALVLPALLWHEPLTELLYLAKVSRDWDLATYYALGIRAAAAGLATGVIDGILRGVRRATFRPALAE